VPEAIRLKNRPRTSQRVAANFALKPGWRHGARASLPAAPGLRCSPQRPASRARQAKWDYRVSDVFRPTNPPGNYNLGDHIQIALNNLGGLGWELVASQPVPPGGPNEGVFLILKRPLAE
jgi:hypothetical protein